MRPPRPFTIVLAPTSFVTPPRLPLYRNTDATPCYGSFLPGNVFCRTMAQGALSYGLGAAAWLVVMKLVQARLRRHLPAGGAGCSGGGGGGGDSGGKVAEGGHHHHHHHHHHDARMCGA
ncbi:hypothetical protein Vretifemale_2331 [Volvox reticuliferus]|nr:hypothetical protein Vretifemale_2331 [Volvox reticuliferus]